MRRCCLLRARFAIVDVDVDDSGRGIVCEPLGMQRDFLVEGLGNALLVHRLVTVLGVIYGFLYDGTLLTNNKPCLLGHGQILFCADSLDDLALIVRMECPTQRPSNER